MTRRPVPLLVLVLLVGMLAGCATTNDRTTVAPSYAASSSTPTIPASTVVPSRLNLVAIPTGEYEMGDHLGYVDPQHPSDEIPLHTVRISRFYMGKFDVTVSEYCRYLNSDISENKINVADGLVYLAGGKEVLFQTRQAGQYSRIGWDGRAFSVLDNKDNHPVTSVMWCGAATYCNWLSTRDGLQACYNTNSWDCDFTKNGYRLPIEAEWEYAARGGQHSPYGNYPWGIDADKTKANWPGSGDPYESGPLPWTTPVGFYDGRLHSKKDFAWPGVRESYQTSNGANGYGLYDMAGNVWQWCNDWYRQDYYKVSPATDPTGPTISQASPMPDGKAYHVLRGGNWYNGERDAREPAVDNGHSRVSNRDPAYFRGPQDPNHPYYHIGFRIVRRY